MRTYKFLISSIIFLIVISEACSFWHFSFNYGQPSATKPPTTKPNTTQPTTTKPNTTQPTTTKPKTTQTPACPAEIMAKCPGNGTACTGPNQEVRWEGPNDCCDVCYTLLGEGDNCDVPDNQYAVCSDEYFCINSKCI